MKRMSFGVLALAAMSVVACNKANNNAAETTTADTTAVTQPGPPTTDTVVTTTTSTVDTIAHGAMGDTAKKDTAKHEMKKK